jgi:hypothetical protein
VVNFALRGLGNLPWSKYPNLKVVPMKPSRVLIVAAALVFLVAAPAAAKKRGLSECDAAAQITAEISEALTVCGAFPDLKSRLEAAIFTPQATAVVNLAAACPVSDWNVVGPRGRLAFLRAVESAGAQPACDAFISELR